MSVFDDTEQVTVDFFPPHKRRTGLRGVYLNGIKNDRIYFGSLDRTYYVVRIPKDIIEYVCPNDIHGQRVRFVEEVEYAGEERGSIRLSTTLRREDIVFNSKEVARLFVGKKVEIESKSVPKKKRQKSASEN